MNLNTRSLLVKVRTHVLLQNNYITYFVYLNIFSDNIIVHLPPGDAHSANYEGSILFVSTAVVAVLLRSK